jgi:hypothetical protein
MAVGTRPTGPPAPWLSGTRLSLRESEMEELFIEIAVQLGVSGSGGLTARLLRRTSGGVQELAHWTPDLRGMTPSEVEDMTSAVAKAILDQLLVGPGVQLALHD